MSAHDPSSLPPPNAPPNQVGSLFGEFAVLASNPISRSASIRASINTYLLALNKEDYHRVMEQFPDIQKEVLQKVNRKVKEVEENASYQEKIGLIRHKKLLAKSLKMADGENEKYNCPARLPSLAATLHKSCFPKNT